MTPLEDCLKGIVAKQEAQDPQIRSLRTDLEKATEELEKVIGGLNRERKRRLKLFIGNCLYDLAKLIFPSLKSDASIQQLATKVTGKQLTKANIPAKYWPLIKDLPKCIAVRNDAHASAGEFAELLISLKKSHRSVYETWAPAFPVVYGGTVEEVAEREMEQDDALLGF
jgi:hypothetical protein